MEFIKALILGIIQGITEWLPVSSTGHLLLADEFCKLGGGKSFVDMFMVVIQFGSILAVVTLYFHKLNPFSPKKTSEEKKQTWTMWFKVLAATIPAGIAGILLDDWISANAHQWYIIAAALIVYGILFIVLENRNKKPNINSINDMSYKTAVLIGCFQMLSLIPGTSRSGSTILGAVFMGTSRAVAAEFSFFLAIPVMIGASGLKIAKYVLKSGFAFPHLSVLIFGTAVAYLISLAAIKFLMGYIRKHDFKAFGWYRIILGIVVILYFSIFA